MNSYKKNYDLSIVIPTINNPLKLIPLISSIDNQNRYLRKKIEVIIVFQKDQFSAKF